MLQNRSSIWIELGEKSKVWSKDMPWYMILLLRFSDKENRNL